MSSQSLLLAASAIIAVVALPLILKWVPPNPIYGFRTHRTLTDPDLWYRANQFSGWALLAAALVSAVLIVALPGPPNVQLLEFVAPIVVALVASLVYVWRAA